MSVIFSMKCTKVVEGKLRRGSITLDQILSANKYRQLNTNNTIRTHNKQYNKSPLRTLHNYTSYKIF